MRGYGTLPQPLCRLRLREARACHPMEAPTVFVRGKLPADVRKPCLLDVPALGALRAASTKLHKKTSIALTKWHVWDPEATVWRTRMMVPLRMFAADMAAGFCDTRIWHRGRLTSWKAYCGTAAENQFRPGQAAPRPGQTAP